MSRGNPWTSNHSILNAFCVFFVQMWSSRAYLLQDESTAFPSVPDPFLIETNLNTRAIASLLTNHPWDVAPRCSEVLSSVSTVKLFPGTPRPGVSWGSGDLGCVAGVEIHTTGDACSCSYCSAWCSHSFEAQRDVCHSVLSHAFPSSCLRSSPRPILLALCGLKSCETVSFWGIQRGWSDRLEANDYLLDLYIFQQSEPQMTCGIFFFGILFPIPSVESFESQDSWQWTPHFLRYNISEELGQSHQESSFYQALHEGTVKGTCMILDEKAHQGSGNW